MWLYQNKPILKIEDFPEKNIFGFIYKIVNLKTNQIYIGKKQIFSKTKIKLGKKELAALPIQRGRKQTKKEVIKESNWKEYNSSCQPLLDDIKKYGEENFSKEILIFCKNKKLLTYWEIAFQIKEDVLLKNSYNTNISGHFYSKDFL